MPDQLGIGEVLSVLKPDFPDVSISKIRFLESEGLITPSRTPSGYRKFSPTDIARIRTILTMQRDQYLPLKVIKEHLDRLDQGLEPIASSPSGSVKAEDFRATRKTLRLTTAELAEQVGLDESTIGQLVSFGLLTPTPTGHFDDDAVSIGGTIAAMSIFGIEPRHLRSFKVAADREVGLVEQVITPWVGNRGPEAKSRARETVRELAALSVRLHAALVKATLARGGLD